MQKSTGQKILYILNQSPYASESTLNALRFALALKEQHPATELKIFCFSDAVLSAMQGQQPKEGVNIQEYIDILTGLDVEIKLCTTCANARAIKADYLTNGVTLGTLSDISQWTLWADKVITF